MLLITRGGTSIACATKVLLFAPLLNLVYRTSVEKKENNGSVECCGPAMREIGTPRPERASVIARAYFDICKKRRAQWEIIQIFWVLRRCPS